MIEELASPPLIEPQSLDAFKRDITDHKLVQETARAFAISDPHLLETLQLYSEHIPPDADPQAAFLQGAMAVLRIILNKRRAEELESIPNAPAADDTEIIFQ